MLAVWHFIPGVQMEHDLLLDIINMFNFQSESEKIGIVWYISLLTTESLGTLSAEILKMQRKNS